MFYLWMKQEGEGCDYTIGCGQKLIPLKASSSAEAVVEASLLIADYDYEELESALILQGGDIDMMPVVRELVFKKQEEASKLRRERKEAEFERLKKELGK